MKGSLDDNYSIPRFPSIDENLNVSRKRSIARRPFNKAFLFLFLHFPRPPPPMATFSLPSQGENQSDAMPDTRDPGRRSPLGRSPIEGQSGEGKGFFSRKLSGNSCCCCTFCSCCARKMQREKERGWDEGWAGNEFRMAFSRDYAFRFYNGERRVPRHVSILIGFDDRPAFRKGYWWKIEASAVRFLSWKRIDTFEFNLLRRKPLQYCTCSLWELTVSPLIK